MENTLSVILIIAFVIILPLYLKAEKSFSFNTATLLKLILSTIFTVNGIIHIANVELKDFYYYSQLIVVVGLMCAWIGDFFLQYIKRDIKKFHTGVIFFTVTQVLFLVSMTINNGFGWLELVTLILPLGIAVVVMNKQNWQLGDSRKVLSFYTLLIALMTSKAFVTLITTQTISSLIFALGASLFFVSDILLGVWNFYKQKRIYANLNWITYFSGLLLISISVMLI